MLRHSRRRTPTDAGTLGTAAAAPNGNDNNDDCPKNERKHHHRWSLLNWPGLTDSTTMTTSQQSSSVTTTANNGSTTVVGIHKKFQSLQRLPTSEQLQGDSLIDAAAGTMPRSFLSLQRLPTPDELLLMEAEPQREDVIDLRSKDDDNEDGNGEDDDRDDCSSASSSQCSLSLVEDDDDLKNDDELDAFVSAATDAADVFGEGDDDDEDMLDDYVFEPIEKAIEKVPSFVFSSTKMEEITVEAVAPTKDSSALMASTETTTATMATTSTTSPVEEISFQEQQHTKHRRRLILRAQFAKRKQELTKEVTKEVDVGRYMAAREMTPLQERLNAITMIPSPIYCMLYILSGWWVNTALVDKVRQDVQLAQEEGHEYIFDDHVVQEEDVWGGCLPTSPSDSSAWAAASSSMDEVSWFWSWFSSYHSMPTLPPWPVLAVALAITIHAPFSFLYHWRCASKLPPGMIRTTHWTRRMDHSMIHFASALMSYATSGSILFFTINALFNCDCIYRQFKTKVRPRSNKVRVIISVLAYTLPMMCHGQWLLFFELWIVLTIAFMLFAMYPIGGWSHAAFHLVLAFAPPFMMLTACQLPISQKQIALAAKCIVYNEMQHQQQSVALQ